MAFYFSAYPGLTDGRERGGRGDANRGPCFPYTWKIRGEVTIHVLHAGLQMGMGGVGMGGLLDLHY